MTARASPKESIGKLPFLTTHLLAMQFMYLFCYMSASPWFQWPKCETWKCVFACARFISTTRQFLMPNLVDKWPTSLLSTCPLLSHENAKPKFKPRFTNIIEVSDVIPVTEGAGSVEYEPVQLATVILHSSMGPTAWLTAQTWCTWSSCW